MLMRIFIFTIVLIAVLVGILAMVLPNDQLIKLVKFRDFFDITLPILGFGALVKYLCTCVGCKICHDHTVHNPKVDVTHYS